MRDNFILKLENKVNLFKFIKKYRTFKTKILESRMLPYTVPDKDIELHLRVIF